MKLILTVFIVLSFYNLNAQSPHYSSAKMNSHSWAGGMCCSNGQDYTITIYLEKGFNNCFDSVIAEVDGMKVSVPEKSFTKTEFNDSIVQYYFKFGWSNSGREDNNYALKENNYYGIELKDIVFPEEYVNRLTLVRHHNKEIIENLEFTRSITAFP